MKVTMDMQEYETLRDLQIPYTIDETDTKRVVHVSKNVVEQMLAEQLDANDITKESNTGYMTTKRPKEFEVIFVD